MSTHRHRQRLGAPPKTIDDPPVSALMTRELIGVTPKRLARTYRFVATVFSIDWAEPIDWGDLAGSAGYFDQAHFGHEFRAFVNPNIR